MSRTQAQYDVIVIGGGHAGAEAAWAGANLEARVALVTMDPGKIGAMSCNPAIGGLAKGQMVREIDALGGLMALAADATGIQFRILNATKGPAVQGPRCQSDRYRYASEVQRLLATRDAIDIIAGTVERLMVEDGKVTGVEISTRGELIVLRTSAVVLTTGTFMRGLMHTGERQTQGGRVGEQAATGISAALCDLGFELGRLKTGTPPRLAAESIDFDALQVQPGDEHPTPFSDMTDAACGFAQCEARDNHADGAPPQAVPKRFPVLQQRVCWITHTNATIHDAIRANLHRAPMYNGQIDSGSFGPRYCPSIEDKVVRFADRTSHHVFLEPESLDTNEVYCNGISTSLPADVQDEIVRQMPGCKRAEILRYGYAVEYDMVWPHQIDATCMTKHVGGLFLAGQINGTSGYEEAAGQGLVAGLNAVRHARGASPVRLRRDQAYIGVMLDDLVTKTPREPYRMFTSRAEFRLLLRSDNADTRLTPLGREWGLIDNARWNVLSARRDGRRELEHYLGTHKINDQSFASWVHRPDIGVDAVLSHLDGVALKPAARSRRVVQQVLADAQYAGYIDRQHRDVQRLASQEDTLIPAAADYQQIDGLRREAAQVLDRFRPVTFGQAGRLAGVTPADLMIINVALSRHPTGVAV